MTKQEYTLSNGNTSYIIIPDDGKMLVRKSDGFTVHGQITLGYIIVDDDLVLESPDDYEEQDEPTPEPVEVDTDIQYKYLVEQYIRKRYNISDELAILRQRDTKTEEFEEYYNYCEECKTKAKKELNYEAT